MPKAKKPFKFSDNRKTNARRRKEWKQKCKEYALFLKEDYDWDFAYILYLLVYKLERTKKCIIKNNFILNAKQVGAEIQEVVDLFKRYHDFDYSGEAHKEFHKKYGKPKMVSIPPSKEEAKKNPNIGGSLEFHYKGKPLSKEAYKEDRELYKKAMEAQKADLNKAFQLMAERIEGWWD